MNKKKTGNIKGKKKITKNAVLQNILDAREKVKKFTDRVDELINDSIPPEQLQESIAGLQGDFNNCRNFLELIWKDNDFSNADLIFIVMELNSLYKYFEAFAKGSTDGSLVGHSKDHHRSNINFQVQLISMDIDEVFIRLRRNEERDSTGASNQQSDNRIEKIFWHGLPSDLAEIMHYLWDKKLIFKQATNKNRLCELLKECFIIEDPESSEHLRQLLSERIKKPAWDFHKI
jgi:hypothetical protein